MTGRSDWATLAGQNGFSRSQGRCDSRLGSRGQLWLGRTSKQAFLANVSSLDSDLDRPRIELKWITPKKRVFKYRIIGPNPR